MKYYHNFKRTPGAVGWSATRLPMQMIIVDAAMEDARSIIYREGWSEGSVSHLRFITAPTLRALVSSPEFQQHFLEVSGSQQVEAVVPAPHAIRGHRFVHLIVSSTPCMLPRLPMFVDEFGLIGAVGPQCGDTSRNGWRCNRPPGHEGQHIAVGTGEVLERWDPDVFPRIPRTAQDFDAVADHLSTCSHRIGAFECSRRLDHTGSHVASDGRLILAVGRR